MSISSIFTELDIIRGDDADSSTYGTSANTKTVQSSDKYVSEASILLAERKVAKEKQKVPITVPKNLAAHSSSSSMDQIMNTAVDAPTYWKSNLQNKKQKSKAYKSEPVISKKNRAKLDKAQSYTDRLQAKHTKWETKTNKKTKALKLA
jgi:hypothetical protein